MCKNVCLQEVPLAYVGGFLQVFGRRLEWVSGDQSLANEAAATAKLSPVSSHRSATQSAVVGRHPVSPFSSLDLRRTWEM